MLIQPRLHSLNQGYTTHIDIRPYGHRSDSTSLSTTMPVVPLSCEPANTLCCCEWWWWWGVQLGLCEQGCVCVCVCSGKIQKMRDSQRAIPEWCPSAPCSKLSTPNESFQTSRKALESGCFPAAGASVCAITSKFSWLTFKFWGKMMYFILVKHLLNLVDERGREGKCFTVKSTKCRSSHWLYELCLGDSI